MDIAEKIAFVCARR